MKILILTQYFPPETVAAANRLYELSKGLKKNGVDVTILTAMPNHPRMEVFDEYKNKRYVYEEIDSIPVHRTAIFVSKKKFILHRLMNYFSFTITSYLKGRKLPEFDYILCNSPPLFLGYSALALSKKLNAKLIFNVSDLWPESAEKLGIVTNKWLLKLAYDLEARCYKNATLVTGQTQGIVNNIKDRFPNTSVYWLPNGAELTKFDPNKVIPSGFREKYNIAKHDIVFFYGGVFGHAQGLDILIHAASKIKSENIKFVFLGSGPLKEELQRLVNDLDLNNVIFCEPVLKTEMPQIVQEIDVSIIPLKNLPIFKGAIPSKIFEILAMEKPIILGVNGEAKELFIEQGQAGWYYEPENTDALVKVILEAANNETLRITFGQNGRSYVSENFDRDAIADTFYKKISKLEHV